MELFFLGIAAAGGTLLLCQFLLGLLGLGEHGGVDQGDGHLDVHHDSDHGDSDHGDSSHSSWFFGMLSLRAIAAALTFFGLAGLAAHYRGLEPGHCVLIAIGAGGLSMYAVARLMRMLARLKSDGTVRMEKAVGLTGTVYLRIPARRSGAGKVTLVVQNRTVEWQAVTGQDEIPTGARVTVVALAGPDTVEVIPVNVENPAHV